MLENSTTFTHWKVAGDFGGSGMETSSAEGMLGASRLSPRHGDCVSPKVQGPPASTKGPGGSGWSKGSAAVAEGAAVVPKQASAVFAEELTGALLSLLDSPSGAKARGEGGSATRTSLDSLQFDPLSTSESASPDTESKSWTPSDLPSLCSACLSSPVSSPNSSDGGEPLPQLQMPSHLLNKLTASTECYPSGVRDVEEKHRFTRSVCLMQDPWEDMTFTKPGFESLPETVDVAPKQLCPADLELCRFSSASSRPIGALPIPSATDEDVLVNETKGHGIAMNSQLPCTAAAVQILRNTGTPATRSGPLEAKPVSPLLQPLRHSVPRHPLTPLRQSPPSSLSVQALPPSGGARDLTHLPVAGFLKALGVPGRSPVRLFLRQGVAPALVADYVRRLCLSLEQRMAKAHEGGDGPDVWVPGTPRLKECYCLGAEIGRGHFGVVRVCEDVSSRQRRACKTILKSSIKKVSDVEELLCEVTAMLKLQEHQSNSTDYFLHLHEVIDEDDAIHLILDFCNGGDLFERVASLKRLTEVEAAHIFKQLLLAVHHMHSLGLIHRDLKPENILLEMSKTNLRGMPKVRVADFGLCVHLQEGQMVQGLAGSPFYMAPEIVLRKPYRHEVDIWSLGAMLYMCLSGTLPFWDKDRQGVFAKVVAAKPDFQRKPWPTVSQDAKALVKSMLNPEPTLRPKVRDVLLHPWLLKHCPEMRTHNFLNK